MRQFLLLGCFLMANLVLAYNFAPNNKSVKIDITALKAEFYSGNVLSFSTELNRSLVISCNGSYGLVGLSDEKFVAYNRINPAVKLTKKKCFELLHEVRFEQKGLTFEWKKISDQPVQYQSRYSLQ